MANILTLHASATNGARISRYGDAIMVVMESIAFMTTAQEYQMAMQWARSKQSLGNIHKDRVAFAGRFETLIGRSGGGCATKGSNKVLGLIVKTMEQNGMDIKEWMLPPNLFEDMEVKKKPKQQEPAAEASDAEQQKSTPSA